jgi:phosphatidylglycerol---prolipoprotein diacylglyceryl transferase
MLTHPNIDPVALSLGPISVHWYGLMYVAAFVQFLWLSKLRARKHAWLGWSAEEVDDVLFYGFIGVIVGGRLGEVILYQLPHHLANPLDIFKIWQGGMSFHGGFIGVLVGMWLYARKSKRTFWQVTDFIAPQVPLGYAFGRVGNFINQELIGRPTDVAWGVVFPKLNDGIARHPSQLYHALLDGVLLFVVLWFYSASPRPVKRISALFLIGYGLTRSFVEFFRTPDFSVQLAGVPITSGQLYSIPMILVGIYLWMTARVVGASIRR